MGATRLLPPWMGNHWRRPSNGFSCLQSALETWNWEAARAYCEADVRELAAVYESIAEATPGHKRASVPADENTTQTGLMDF